jgi:hypothetical protein
VRPVKGAAFRRTRQSDQKLVEVFTHPNMPVVAPTLSKMGHVDGAVTNLGTWTNDLGTRLLDAGVIAEHLASGCTGLSSKCRERAPVPAVYGGAHQWQ